MLRPLEPADAIPLIELTGETGFFKPLELVALGEVFDDYFRDNRDYGHLALVEADGDRVLGFVYFAPVPMTEGTWSLYWIVVAKDQQGRGLGRRLLEAVENEVRERDGRLLLIETSALPKYESTREFYRRRGYLTAAEIPDYYAEGDGLVIYSKRV
jgi:ribosomal protein S18 acetylase RimI-like enzyme